MRHDNTHDKAVVCFGEFEVKDIETEVSIDLSVGYYLKVIETDAFSKVEPFCFDLPLNSDSNELYGLKVIGNIHNKEGE